jgi:hypothetical protein
MSEQFLLFDVEKLLSLALLGSGREKMSEKKAAKQRKNEKTQQTGKLMEVFKPMRAREPIVTCSCVLLLVAVAAVVSAS